MKSMQSKNKKENNSSTYVALLRGINVGGNSKVEMPKLKLLFESFGFTFVKTYINSGNIIFQSHKQDISELEKLIEKELEKAFCFPIKIVIRTASNIAKLYKQIPLEWENDTKQKTDILFLWDEYDSKSTLKLITTNKDVDTLLYIDGAIIWS